MAAKKSFNPEDYLTKIKKNDYLEVKWRIKWFRHDHPGGNIDTTPMVIGDATIIKATVADGNGVALASGIATVRAAESKNITWAGREFEKAETAAIGRALAVAGFGTQFTDDFDEGDYLADSPVAANQTRQSGNGTKPQLWTDDPAQVNQGKEWKALAIEKHGKPKFHVAQDKIKAGDYDNVVDYLGALSDILLGGGVKENETPPAPVKTGYQEATIALQTIESQGENKKKFYRFGNDDSNATLWTREPFRVLGLDEKFIDDIGEVGKHVLPVSVIAKWQSEGAFKKVIALKLEETGYAAVLEGKEWVLYEPTQENA